MARFSVSDVATTGFRVVTERPVSVAIWALLLFAFTLGFSVLMAQTAGPALVRLQALNATANPDPAKVWAALRDLLPMYLLMVPLYFANYSIQYATASRVVLRPGDRAFAYLRLGADELRQFGLMLLKFLVYFGLYLAVVISAAVLAVVGTGFIGAFKHGGLLSGLWIVLVVLVAVTLFIYVVVRLSLASPLTFASGKVDLFGSWKLTRGQFWPMLLAYILVGILCCIVWLIGVVVIGAIMMVVGGGLDGLTALYQPDMGSVNAVLAPLRLTYFAGSAILMAITIPVFMTPQAAIYQALANAAASGSQTPASLEKI
jgi:hypothetical protein